MAGSTKFPGALDDGSTLYQPGGGDLVASVDHAALHDNASVAIIAAETKVGTGSSTPTSGTVLRGNGTGTSTWAQANLTTDVTGTLPVANGGTGATAATGTGNVVLANTPSLTNPAFSSITNTGTLTLPSSTDTLVGRATTDTLTNKSIDGGSNTFTNVPISSLTGAWISYTPTWTNVTQGTGAVVGGAYVQIGKTVHFYASIKLGTSGALTGNLQVSLPVSTVSTTGAYFVCPTYGLQVGTSNWIADSIIDVSSSTTATSFTAYNNGNSWNATVPFTWAVNCKIYISGTYQAA